MTQTIDIICEIVYTKNTINIFYGNNILKGCDNMPDYEKLYHKTYNAITDAERLIESASILLRMTQQECENLYVESSDSPSEDK